MSNRFLFPTTGATRGENQGFLLRGLVYFECGCSHYQWTDFIDGGIWYGAALQRGARIKGEMPMQSVNAFSIRRDLAGHRVELKAERIARLEVFAVTVRVNGELWDSQQSDNVLADAVTIFEDAFMELAEPACAVDKN